MTREEIIERVKENTRIKTTRVTTLCQYNIDAVQDLHIARNIYGHQFSFLKEYGYINTSPCYTTGTVTVTQDSTAVTGLTTVWTSSHIGWIFKISGADEYYEVSDVTGNTALTLSSAYIGSTASAQPYYLYKVAYPLASDFGNLRWIKQLDSPARVIPKADLSFQTLIPNDFDPSGNIYGYILGEYATYQYIRFTPIQTTRKRLYYCYDKKLATLNGTGLSSAIPSDWHWLFVHKLSEIIFDVHDLSAKARLEEAKFNAMLKQFIDEDLSISRDTENVMQDEGLYKTDSTPYAHLPSQYSPDL